MNKLKIFMIMILCLGVFYLTGCTSNENEIKCKINEEYEDKTMETEVKATMKDDKINKITATLTFDSDNTAVSYYNLFKSYEELSNDEEKIEAKLDGKVVTIENFDNYLKKSQNADLIGKDKDEFIKMMESMQYKCEK